MMRYYVNTRRQANGDHEVHKADCSFLPSAENRHLLGEFATCAQAVRAARVYYPHANGCVYCSPECHTS
jgi:hypothetical protein